ncbi:MAG: monovalent cation/H(+) antiporter subunit G [Actinomycetota bacterium]|nr:monovalent cation/H(+) antiporter subunit G [Actinomycetota bacterium]
MAQDIVAGVFICIGTVFFIIGTTGLLRMPDLYSRLHPATKCDTLGACSVMLGMAVYSGFTFNTLKLLLIIFFLLFSSATVGHSIGRSALKRGIRPWRKENTGGGDEHSA